MNVFELKVVNSDRVRFAIDGGPTFDFADSDIPRSVAQQSVPARKS